MARTRVENYSSAFSTEFEKPFKESTNKMASTSNRYSDTFSNNSNSTHSSIDSVTRRKEIATSINKFVADDEEIDYLENLTSKSKTPSSISISKNSRRKVPSSYRKSESIPEDRERDDSIHHSSKHRRPNIPPNPRSSASKPRSTRSPPNQRSSASKPRSTRSPPNQRSSASKPRSTRRGLASKPRSSRSKPTSQRIKNSKRDVYEGGLNDQKPRESAQSLMASARRLLDKAARAASPGRLRKERSSSPGPHKTKNSIQEKKPGSPTSSSTAPSSGEGVTSSSKQDSPKRKPHSKSPGRLKKRESEDDSGEKPKSTRSKRRSESPGKHKKRSQSPGKLKKRAQSPGALRKTARPRRRPENREDETRAKSNGPMKRPERAKSNNRASSVSRRSKRDVVPSKPSRSTRSDDVEKTEGDEPLKKDQSYSNMQDELNRYKVKRNKSMNAATTQRTRTNVEKLTGDDDDDDLRQPPRRANSMMLSREMGRRGKSNSLADLIQYKEEEIHSTSYFASNHVLINRERMKRGLRPLTRNVPMDQMARKCAETMAESTGLQHLPTTYVGNVLRGENIRMIHRSTMLQKQGRERQNILNPYFQDFGVGTCKGKDGMLYMCQLFSERLQITLTDTVNEVSPENAE